MRMRILLTGSKSVTALQLLFVLTGLLSIEKIGAFQPLSAQRRETSANETGTELDRPSQYIGVTECPCAIHGGDDTPLFGYIFWSDVVYDVNHAVIQKGDSLSIIMCPNNYHDALHLPNMTIQQSNILIQCGAMGLPDGCIVDGASILIADNLKNVTIHGVEFVSQRHELSIGKGSQISLLGCRFSNTIFPGAETLRSAVVSHGELTIVNSYFSGNFGGSAVHVVQNEASFTNVQFVDNTASQHKNSASAIHVGESTNEKIANISIINSCFEKNIGTNIVFVHEGSLVLRNRDNAVLATSDGKTKCHGITMQLGNGTMCKKFQLLNVSCKDAVDRCGPVVVDTIAPVPPPVPTFNNSNITAEVKSSPVHPAPTGAPAPTIKGDDTANEGTLSPVSTPKKTLTLQPTTANGDKPTILLDLTGNDDIIPLDITNDITFGESGYDVQPGKIWIVTILTTLVIVVIW